MEFTNPNWDFVEQNKSYDVSVEVVGYRPWNGIAYGIERRNEKGVIISALKAEFLRDLARAPSAIISIGTKVRLRLSFYGSSAALDGIIACQKQRDAQIVR